MRIISGSPLHIEIVMIKPLTIGVPEFSLEEFMRILVLIPI